MRSSSPDATQQPQRAVPSLHCKSCRRGAHMAATAGVQLRRRGHLSVLAEFYIHLDTRSANGAWPPHQGIQHEAGKGDGIALQFRQTDHIALQDATPHNQHVLKTTGNLEARGTDMADGEKSGQVHQEAYDRCQGDNAGARCYIVPCPEKAGSGIKRPALLCKNIAANWLQQRQ